MEATIIPSPIGGEICSIPSKSHAHRVLICAALSQSPTEIVIDQMISRDIEVTIACLESLGAKIERQENGNLMVSPVQQSASPCVIDCCESGSTLRFLLPVVAGLGKEATFIGQGRLPQRPIAELLQQLKNHGVLFSDTALPLTIQNKLQGGTFQLSGNESSQYITGILLALPLLPEGGEIALLTPLQSKSYVDITIDVMRTFGVHVEEVKSGYRVSAGQHYHSPGNICVEGDWSNSAFWLGAGALSLPVHCKNLNVHSPQGDKTILSILEQYGADIRIEEGDVFLSPGQRNAFFVDASDIPDLVPMLCVLASVAQGTSEILQVERLRLKESDRITATLDLLHALGASAEYHGGTLFIHGRKALLGGTVNGVNDHRIVMSAAIASCVCTKPVEITDAQAVFKSYPHFFDDFITLGGKVNVV